MLRHPASGNDAPSSDERVITRKEQVWNIVEDNMVASTMFLLVIVFSTCCFILETEFKDPEQDFMWFAYAAARCRPPARPLVHTAALKYAGSRPVSYTHLTLPTKA